MSKRTKVLIISHSGYLYSGNAEVVRNIFTSLLYNYPDDYDIIQLGLVNISAVTRVPWPVVPTKVELDTGMLDAEDLYGEKTLPGLLTSWQPDVVFIHNDPYPTIKALQHIPSHIKVVAYLSVDGIPLQISCGALKRAEALVTMTEFSKTALLDVPDLRNRDISIISAPVDISRFTPVCNDVKTAIRTEIVPSAVGRDSFIVGWVGRNQWRKQMWINYAAISKIRHGDYRYCTKCLASIDRESKALFCSHCGSSEFETAQPTSNVVLWIHLPTGKVFDTWNIEELERHYGLLDGKDIIYTYGCDSRNHISPKDMPILYQSWDALLFCSGGEGFGVPALEAMACGLPVIYSSYSSHAEIVEMANAGVPVAGQLQPEPLTNTLRCIANVQEVVDAIMLIRRNLNLANRLSENGIKFSAGVTCARIAEKWHKIFQSV